MKLDVATKEEQQGVQCWKEKKVINLGYENKGELPNI